MWLYRGKIINWIKIEDKDNILLEVYIPRIKLREVVYNIDSRLNDVDYHIEILDNSDIDKNLLFLASHSGSGNASYFDNLVYLEKGDFIWLNISDKRYVFIVEEMFYIQKNGYFEVSYDGVGNTLFLITCSLKYVDRQLVVKAKLIYKC